MAENTNWTSADAAEAEALVAAHQGTPGEMLAQYAEEQQTRFVESPDKALERLRACGLEPWWGDDPDPISAMLKLGDNLYWPDDRLDEWWDAFMLALVTAGPELPALVEEVARREHWIENIDTRFSRLWVHSIEAQTADQWTSFKCGRSRGDARVVLHLPRPEMGLNVVLWAIKLRCDSYVDVRAEDGRVVATFDGDVGAVASQLAALVDRPAPQVEGVQGEINDSPWCEWDHDAEEADIVDDHWDEGGGRDGATLGL